MHDTRRILTALAFATSTGACVSLDQIAADAAGSLFWSALGVAQAEDESLLFSDRARDERVSARDCSDLGAQLSSARTSRDGARLRAAQTTGLRADRGISAGDALTLERRSEDRVIALEREGARLGC